MYSRWRHKHRWIYERGFEINKQRRRQIIERINEYLKVKPPQTPLSCIEISYWYKFGKHRRPNKEDG